MKTWNKGKPRGRNRAEWVMKNLKFLKYQVEVEQNEKPE
jgi:hypothetical protein